MITHLRLVVRRLSGAEAALINAVVDISINLSVRRGNARPSVGHGNATVITEVTTTVQQNIETSAH